MDKDIPITYQDISNRLAVPGTDIFELRKQTMQEIEGITKNSLISYVSKTSIRLIREL
jgi:hypothetical protein